MKLNPDCYMGLRPVLPNEKPWDVSINGLTESVNGLQVWDWAGGDIEAIASWKAPGVIWLAVMYLSQQRVDLGGSTKIPRCRTVFAGKDPKEVCDFIRMYKPDWCQGYTFFQEKVVGDGGSAWVGSMGTAIAGNEGAAHVRGFGGRAIAGDGGFAEVGDGGYAEAGIGGVAIAGRDGTVLVGAGGSAKAGIGGTLVFGDRTLRVGVGGIQPDTFYSH